MKTIPKFQEGGFASLFTQYVPLASSTPRQQSTAPAKAESTQRETKKDDKLTQKDLITLVSQVDGLPNDTNYIVSKLNRIFSIQSLTGTSTSDMASSYLSNLISLKQANFNKKEYDKAYTVVNQNGALNEYAITISGDVVVHDKEHNIKSVSVEELLKNRDQYSPLTNSNLLYLRAYDPKYTMNNAIFDTVQNGIGIEKVDKMIRERLGSLGTSETIRSGYSVKENDQIMQGLKVLSQIESEQIAGASGMTLDGMYKNEIITKEQKEQAEAALVYIYSTLPENAKTLLSIKSGNSENPRKGAIDIIRQLITSRMTVLNSSKSDYEGTLKQITTKGLRSKTENGAVDDQYSDDVKTDPYYNMVRQIGGNDLKLTINKGSNQSMSVNGKVYGSVPDFQGKPIPRTSLSNMLSQGIQGITTDTTSITFGNVQLDSSDFDNIVYDGGSGAIGIFPVKIGPGGSKTIDLDSLTRWENAKTQLSRMGIDNIYDTENQEKIAKVLYDNNLEHLINISDGSIDYSQFEQFLIVDGYAVTDSSDSKFESEFIREIYNPDDRLIKTLETALSTNSDKDNYSIDVDNWYDWNGHNNIYQGTIYIPITHNQLQALTASGQNIKEPVAMEKEYEWQMAKKRRTAKKPGTIYEGQ